MGYDRGVLPPDRDRPDSFPWKGVIAALVIIGGLAAVFYFVIYKHDVYFPDAEGIGDILTLLGGSYGMG